VRIDDASIGARVFVFEAAAYSEIEYLQQVFIERERRIDAAEERRRCIVCAE